MKCPYCNEELTIIKRGKEYQCHYCNKDLRKTPEGKFCEVVYNEKSGAQAVGFLVFIIGIIVIFIAIVSRTHVFAVGIIGIIMFFVGKSLMSYRPYTIVGYPPPKETSFKSHPLPPSFNSIRTPTEFEKTVALLLEKMGYGDVRHIGGPRDKAIDITCYKDGLLHAVQCKKFDSKHKVGSRTMQNFCVMMKEYHEIERGMFVTTSTFTKDAKDIAKKFNVELIDGHALRDLMQRFIERPQVPEQDFQLNYITRMRTLRELNEAARARYEAAGVKEWKWLASTDSCPICISLNGKRFPITKTQVPPIHPNCTCTIVPVIDAA